MSESIFSLHVVVGLADIQCFFILYSASFRVPGKAVITSVEALVDAVNLNNNNYYGIYVYTCMCVLHW